MDVARVVVVRDSTGGRDEQNEHREQHEQDNTAAPAPLAGRPGRSPTVSAPGSLALVQPGQQAAAVVVVAVLSPGVRLILTRIPVPGGRVIPGLLPRIRGHVEVTRVVHVPLIPRMTLADLWPG